MSRGNSQNAAGCGQSPQGCGACSDDSERPLKTCADADTKGGSRRKKKEYPPYDPPETCSKFKEIFEKPPWRAPQSGEKKKKIRNCRRSVCPTKAKSAGQQQQEQQGKCFKKTQNIGGRCPIPQNNPCGGQNGPPSRCRSSDPPAGLGCDPCGPQSMPDAKEPRPMSRLSSPDELRQRLQHYIENKPVSREEPLDGLTPFSGKRNDMLNRLICAPSEFLENFIPECGCDNNICESMCKDTAKMLDIAQPPAPIHHSPERCPPRQLENPPRDEGCCKAHRGNNNQQQPSYTQCMGASQEDLRQFQEFGQANNGCMNQAPADNCGCNQNNFDCDDCGAHQGSSSGGGSSRGSRGSKGSKGNKGRGGCGTGNTGGCGCSGADTGGGSGGCGCGSNGGLGAVGSGNKMRNGGKMQSGSGGKIQCGNNKKGQCGGGGNMQSGSGGRLQSGSGGRLQSGSGGRLQSGSGGRLQNGSGGRLQCGSGGRLQNGIRKGSGGQLRSGNNNGYGGGCGPAGGANVANNRCGGDSDGCGGETNGCSCEGGGAKFSACDCGMDELPPEEAFQPPTSPRVSEHVTQRPPAHKLKQIICEECIGEDTEDDGGDGDGDEDEAALMQHKMFHPPPKVKRRTMAETFKMYYEHLANIRRRYFGEVCKNIDEMEDITPETAAAMVLTEEQGVMLRGAPAKLYDYLYPESPSAPLLKIGDVCDNLPEELQSIIVPLVPPMMIEASSFPGLEDPAMLDSPRVIQIGPSMNLADEPKMSETNVPPTIKEVVVGDIEVMSPAIHDADLEVEEAGVEDIFEIKLQGALPPHFSRIQLRGSEAPNWFPGYYVALPSRYGVECINKCGHVLEKAWEETQPETVRPRDGACIIGQ